MSNPNEEPSGPSDEQAAAKEVAKAEADQAASAATKSTSLDDKEDVFKKTPASALPKPAFDASRLIPFLVGGFGLFLIMAFRGQMRLIGVPLGIVATSLCAFGLLDAFGYFSPTLKPSGDAHDGAKRHVVRPQSLAVGLGGLVGMPLLLGLAGRGYSSPVVGWVFGFAILAAFCTLIAGLYLVGRDLGMTDPTPGTRLIDRHGFWLLAIAGFLYLPSLGVFSLWDPWETHYGEVAREILARNDWISLWWAQDGWFWSKPILNFWLQALAMGSLGSGFLPDQMLMGGAGPGTAHPEWVVRAPNALMTLAALYAIYKGVAKVFGRRAGLIGGLALATMPDWYFLAHQTMADMGCVSAMTAAMGLLLYGLNTDESVKVRERQVQVFGRTMAISGKPIAFFVVLLFALPQAIYLLSRNIELITSGSARGFRLHWDEFQRGSAFNCGIPGNEPCRMEMPATLPPGQISSVGHFFAGAEPFLQGALWLVALVVLVVINAKADRVRRLCYHGAWLAAAVATMGKGPMGVVIPAACAFTYLASKKRWSEIPKLELISGALIVGAVAFPWFISMYIRHGRPFIDRLIFHDMINRTLGHVHDTNEGDDVSFRFYLWQLGYALFPWTGLAPFGLVYWMRKGDSAAKGRSDGSIFLVMWVAFGFFLFSFMGTKFHHYIFPVLPPIAMMIGVALDDILPKALGNDSASAAGETPSRATTSRLSFLHLACFGGSALLLTYGVSRFFPGSVLGGVDGQGLPPRGSNVIGIVACAIGLGLGVWAALAERGTASQQQTRGVLEQHQQMLIGSALIAGAAGLAVVGRDLATPSDGDLPGPIRWLQLFTYQYRRPWPREALFMSNTMLAVGITGVVLMLAMLMIRYRRAATYIFVAFAVVTATWGEHIYMVRVSPHWGQREVIEAYYKDRVGPDEELVAYQMNWKGENFYTSNRVPAFVSSGVNFTNYVKGKKEKGVKRMYFVTEHSRTGGLRSEVGTAKFTELTDRKVNNKFVLVRADL
jgi:4-amino-4-deoxy-L-arabinose transferase-like glycosyltransferase